MESVKDSIQQRLDKIRYNYLLLFHPEKIKLSDEILVDGKKVRGKELSRKYGEQITETEKLISELQNMENTSSDNIKTANPKLIEYQNKLVELSKKQEEINHEIEESKSKQERQIYKDKAKLHEKLGAKRFQKFVKKFDKAKFKFIKRIIKEDRMLKWSDRLAEYTAAKKMKKAKTEAEKQEIIDNMRRGKVLVRKQLKEERSINYYQGVDKRVENFYKYISRNKNIHKNSLKMNGALLGVSVGLGIAGVPILPFILAGYQVIAGFKNFQCMNAQDYYLCSLQMRKKAIVKKSLVGIKKTYEENQDLISGIQKGLSEGKDLYSEQGLLDSINTIEGLQQLKDRLMSAKKSQDAIMDKPKEEITIPEAVLDKMITPPENSIENTVAKVAMRK